MCIDCGEPIENPCTGCDDGKHAWGVTSTTTSVIGTSFTMTMSTIGQYSGGWAAVNEHVFIQGYGYFKVTASTSSTISVTEPASPFVGGGSFTVNSIDFQAHGTSGNYTIASGTKVTPAGLKGTTGTDSQSECVQECFTGSQTSSDTSFTEKDTVLLTSPTGVTSNWLSTGDTIEISARVWFNDDASLKKKGFFKIEVDDGSGAINVTTIPSIGDIQLDEDINFAEVKIVLKVASSTTMDREVFLKTAIGDYTSESSFSGITGLGLFPHNDMYYEGTAHSVTWSSPVYIRFYMMVENASDDMKLGHFYVKTFKQIA